MTFAALLKQETGKLSGAVYGTGILKGHQVKQMAADFRAQQTIPAMTQRILEENGCMP